MTIGERAARRKKFIAMLRKPRPHMRGEKSPNWKGGVSYYNSTFKELRKKVLRRAEGSCELCTRNSKLLVHHIDENRKTDTFGKLIALCSGCHKIIHTKEWKAVHPFYRELVFKTLICLNDNYLYFINKVIKKSTLFD